MRDGQAAVIVPVKRAADGSRVLGLPKGHPDGNETPDQAAQREVKEETGLTVELIEELGEVSYDYMRGARRISKRVRFYLFAHLSGNLADHDDEIEDARWMPLEQAARELTYDGEREMVMCALSRPLTDR